MNFEERKSAILLARKKGRSLADIGKEWGISRERVRQIANLATKKKKWGVASQKFRRTCFICRAILLEPAKYCQPCMDENKLQFGGRELVRGVVRGRDNNTCQVCGYVWNRKQAKRLDVHHLDGECGNNSRGYDNFDVLHKLITVCHKCHYNLEDHKEYGKKVNY